MGDETVELPDGLMLKAHAPTADYPSTWKGSDSNRLLFGLIVGLAIALLAELVVAPVMLVNALAPFDGAFRPATATVLARNDFFAEHLYQCRLDLSYEAAGELHRQHADLWIKCPWGPRAGDTVQVSVNPGDPGDVVVQRFDSARSELPNSIGFGALCTITPTLTFLSVVATIYSRVRRLASRKLEWRQLTATMRGFARPESSADMPLVFEAEDTKGRLRVFVANIRGVSTSPWRNGPNLGDRVEMALVANGQREALIATPGDTTPRVVALTVPNRFELRALDLPDL